MKKKIYELNKEEKEKICFKYKTYSRNCMKSCPFYYRTKNCLKHFDFNREIGV